MNDCEKCDAFRELAAVAETERDQALDAEKKYCEMWHGAEATIRTLVVALKKARKWMVAEAVSMQEADEFEADWVTVEAALKSAGSAEDTKFCDFEDCDQEPADGSLLCDGHIQEEEKSHS